MRVIRGAWAASHIIDPSVWFGGHRQSASRRATNHAPRIGAAGPGPSKGDVVGPEPRRQQRGQPMSSGHHDSSHPAKASERGLLHAGPLSGGRALHRPWLGGCNAFSATGRMASSSVPGLPLRKPYRMPAKPMAEITALGASWCCCLIRDGTLVVIYCTAC